MIWFWYLLGFLMGFVLGVIGCILWVAESIPDEDPDKRRPSWDGDYEDVM